ncbi:MAG: DsbA family oxidoreductase [Alphaproteobacteria bacterium]
MRIDVISDTICPWCFIGKRRLTRALAMRDLEPVDIRWRPFQLNPTMPADGMDRDSYLTAKFGSVERAERQYDRIRAAGREENINFRFDLIERIPNTVQSHRLLHFAEGSGLQDTVSEMLFDAYFLRGRDIGMRDELVEVAGLAGLDADLVKDYLTDDQDRPDILAEEDRARLNGVNGVPCFVIDDQYAVSGAQSPEIFLQIFDVVREEHAMTRGRAVAE